MQTKFNKFHVAANGTKARVYYSLDNRADGRPCVTLYAKDYTDALRVVFADLYVNDSDLMTDYFEKGRVVLFADHPMYAAARARAGSQQGGVVIRAPSIPTAAELSDARERAEAARLSGDIWAREFFEARAACYAALMRPPSRREREGGRS